jgi:hypothetical protein
MGFLLELIFEFILEFVLNILFEILAELGLRSIAEVFRERMLRNPFFAVPGCALLGLLCGLISLLLFPHSFIRSQRFHGLSLVLIPLLGGAAMSGIGFLRRKRGEELIRLDSFVYGALFAFGMSLIRFLCTR